MVADASACVYVSLYTSRYGCLLTACTDETRRYSLLSVKLLLRTMHRTDIILCLRLYPEVLQHTIIIQSSCHKFTRYYRVLCRNSRLWLFVVLCTTRYVSFW